MFWGRRALEQQTDSVGYRAASKFIYDEYINSSRWDRRKVLYYSRNPRRCRARGCGATDDIHLHHHTYKRLGNEHDDDLIPLCQAHHVVVHKLHRATRGLTLTAATRQVVGGPLHPPRKRKKPRSRRSQGRGVRPSPDLLPLREVAKGFGISKSCLHKQGYHSRVPVAKVREWRQLRPPWMHGLS